jgi:hypothetical protein
MNTMNYITADVDEHLQFDRNKLLDVVHYVCAKVPVGALGRVRLHRILYLADMLHFVATNRPLTGTEYQRQPFGPYARHLNWALRALQEKGLIEVKRRDYFGFPKHDFLASRTVDSSRLSADETRLIDAVVDLVCNGEAGELSELSPDAACDMVATGERIPYFTAFHLYPVAVTDEDVAWGEAEARKVLAGRDGQKSNV